MAPEYKRNMTYKMVFVIYSGAGGRFGIGPALHLDRPWSNSIDPAQFSYRNLRVDMSVDKEKPSG